MSWTAGYVSEVGYTHGYYNELNPALLRIACLSAGVAPPQMHRFRYLELGFGQGLSINIHAAASDGEFYGIDFNPAHAANALALAAASGAKVVLYDDSFNEFLNRSDVGEFDYIGLHGIWSWISDENRKAIVDIVSRRLKVGGLLYMSYNCLPGWAAAMPLRHLMTMHSDFAGAEAGGMIGKINDALKFAQQVVDSGALYFRANPAVAERLKMISNQNRSYLAHEYFNRDWDVMPFSEVVRWFEDAKLSFVASANLLDHIEVANLTADARKVLADIQHPILRQSVRDYFVNQQFRRDVFIKGARRLSAFEIMETLQSTTFALMTDPTEIPMKVKTVLGEATLQDSVYKPIIEMLAENGFAPKKLGEISRDSKLQSLKFGDLAQALMVLIGAGHVHPTQQPSKEVRSHCRALNQYIFECARGRGEIGWLASPLTGGGVTLNRVQQLFVLAMSSGKKTVSDQAQYAWQIIGPQGGRLMRDGKQLESADDNLAELNQQAMAFSEKRVPILKALGVL